MCFARRARSGVGLATLVLIVSHSAEAQQPRHAGESYMPRPDATAARISPDCAVARDNEMLARSLRLDLTGCDAPAVNSTNAPNYTAKFDSASPVDPSTPSMEGISGKRGRSLLAARSMVLDILGGENACSVWFRQADRNPVGLFRTLSFAVDSKAIDYVVERMNGGKSEAFVNPYVATVVQDGGAYQTITLNAGGAFFRSFASLMRLANEGGPVHYQGGRALKVGPFLGNTLQAQSTTLLHELGHLLALLPLDTHDTNGQSAANTAEVLRHCQGEIESASKHPQFSAFR